MATVSYTVIATGTVDPPVDPVNRSKTIIWDHNHMPQADAVHMFWVSIQPVSGVQPECRAWITKAVQQTSLVERHALVSFDYYASSKANFSVLAVTVTP